MYIVGYDQLLLSQIMQGCDNTCSTSICLVYLRRCLITWENTEC